jgi:putative ABC transport system ATP-binding protein
MTGNIFELQNVSFAYHGESRVLDDLSFEISRNALMIIQGASGAGKSTFLKLFNRFCDISEGKILFSGKELKTYHIDRLRSIIIYLPQLPYVIDGSVEDNVNFPFVFHSHKGKKYSQAKAIEWLDYFQLNVSLDHEALKLSIGQRQRIALIRSMLMEPEVLLLDEPGSALDSANKKLIEQKIESLIESSKITALMATHSKVNFSRIDYEVFNFEGNKLRNVKW